MVRAQSIVNGDTSFGRDEHESIQIPCRNGGDPLDGCVRVVGRGAPAGTRRTKSRTATRRRRTAASSSRSSPRRSTSTGHGHDRRPGDFLPGVAGTLIVHPKDWDDVPRDPKSRQGRAPRPRGGREPKNPTAEASMFYVAYFKNGGGPRPLTFFFNGGPGSATMWLHMGAFGPRRIVTSTDAHTPASPYSLVNNTSSLLDATDLVFIDAPGTGFSRIAGKDKEKAFYRRRSGCPCVRRIHRRNFFRNTIAGIPPSICSAKATARRARPCSSTNSKPIDRSISTASYCSRRFSILI